MNADLESALEERGNLPETLNRARGAVRHFKLVGGINESWWNESLIRGGLCEFASIEEALVRDRRASAMLGEPHGIRSSQNPLLHLMRIMRNLNIHASRLETSSRKAPVVISIGDASSTTTIAISIIDNLTLSGILGSRDILKSYAEDDLRRAVEWFNAKQSVFGAGFLLKEGVYCYCREILHPS